MLLILLSFISDGMYAVSLSQVIIEILLISMVEDYITSCNNHLARGD